ncbi:MAG TPA: ABC transporter substrate-binding protein [Polyangiaceae bacterium]|nr:ABC transporter substrate-binding protein [Polyangiaceae bacterium]
MRRRAAVVVLVLAMVSGCSRADQPKPAASAGGYETLELRYQGNNGTVTPVELAEDLGYLAPLSLSFVGSTISGPHSVQAVVTGDTDFGGAFNGAVIKLIAAKAPIVAVVGYYGVDERRWSGFYVLNESPITSARDLLGKKISMNTLGAHSEFMVKEYLFRVGLTGEAARQVTLVVIPPVNGEQVLRQQQVDVAVLGDIYRDRAVEHGGVRSVVSDYEMFGAFTAGSYVMRREFIRDNPNTARKFVEAVGRAIEWARNNPREQVIERFRAIVAKRGRNEDGAALGYWRSYGVAGRGGHIYERDFQVWNEWMIKDGELAPGQLAVRDLYTNELNPFSAGSGAPAPSSTP